MNNKKARSLRKATIQIIQDSELSVDDKADLIRRLYTGAERRNADEAVIRGRVDAVAGKGG